MTKIIWDAVGARTYEHGVDHGVLYIPTAGVYDKGVAWNGLTAVTETPSGAAATPVYADNMKYLNLTAVEEFGGTIEALTFPDEFYQFDGGALVKGGIVVGQQSRPKFGLSYRTQIGNDLDENAGYKLHLVWGAQAAPAERAYKTINDTPEALPFSWGFTTTGLAITDFKPTALLRIDSTKVVPSELTALETILYGITAGTPVAPKLPTPDEVIALFPTSGTVSP